MVFVVEAIVSVLLSGFFQVLFDRLSPPTYLSKFLQRHELDEILFKNLETTLLQVNAVLNDAEEKQMTNPFVREWVNELKDAAYDTADLLDEIHYRACHGTSLPPKNIVEKAKSTVGKLTKKPEADSKATGESALDRNIKNFKSEIQRMTTKLENLTKRKDVLGLEESFRGKPSTRLQQTSLVDEIQVYGRENDKKKIKDFLLSRIVVGNEIPVVAIIGIAGVGKTTLAQLLYNDSEVVAHFQRKAWIYISEDFDVFRVTKAIYESLTFQNCNITDLNILQVSLKKILNEQKFLIVLDDVWNEYYNKWDALRTIIKVGGSECRIIVTTRSQGVATTMRAIYTCHLQPLEDKDCWSVFANHAFGSHEADAPPKLKSFAHGIMKKCQGLPLAAKVMGSLLYSKVDAREWKNILNSNIWDLPNEKSDILPSLRVSYSYLSSPLKQCFAYCSIFPKGYEFDKEKLILLWMAEGLLQQTSNKTMEEVGIEYFHELFLRSFFQLSDNDKSCYIMHDLINELAQFASGEYCFDFERDNQHAISKKGRHFSYLRGKNDGPEKFDVVRKRKFLWTFLPLSLSSSSGFSQINKTVVEKHLPQQKRLRVLSLSGYGNIDQLPADKFGKLIHLRYLDLSHNAFTSLPDTVGYLYNLQTLILSQCNQLVKLPASLPNLLNLRHLDLNGTSSLQMMPPEFRKLKSLQILTTFVVTRDETGLSNIGELGELRLLRGKLSILNLQNVTSVEDAADAKLIDKENLKEVEFNWSGGVDGQLQETIFEKLSPSGNIEKISIMGYGGERLPDWLGDPLFSNMVSLNISHCRNCLSLPSLGQLSSLQELHVKNCVGLTPKIAWGLNNMTSLTRLTMQCAFAGVTSFPDEGLLPASLTFLQISGFALLETLNLSGLQRLTLLKELEINCTVRLTNLSEGTLPSSVSSLSINGCPSLTDNCQRGQGVYWHKISHIPTKVINGNIII